MEFDQREKALSAVGVAACAAFAAVCAERALNEARKVQEATLRLHPEFEKAIERLWQASLSGVVAYDEDVKTLHIEVSRLIPALLDEKRPDPAIEFAARAISMGLFVLRFPSECGKHAANAGGGMVNLVGTVYSNWKEMQACEWSWQDQAVARLEKLQGEALTRTLFSTIPEYERGPISEDYLSGRLE